MLGPHSRKACGTSPCLGLILRSKERAQHWARGSVTGKGEHSIECERTVSVQQSRPWSARKVPVVGKSVPATDTQRHSGAVRACLTELQGPRTNPSSIGRLGFCRHPRNSGVLPAAAWEPSCARGCGACEGCWTARRAGRTAGDSVHERRGPVPGAHSCLRRAHVGSIWVMLCGSSLLSESGNPDLYVKSPSMLLTNSVS